MGRELKRVALDFDWPMHRIWQGYLNPHRGMSCEVCGASGYSPEARRMHDEWYGNAPFDPTVYGATPLTPQNAAIIDLAQRNCGYISEDGVKAEVARLYRHFRGRWCHQLIQVDVDALVAADRLWDFTRRPRNDEQKALLNTTNGYWMTESNGYCPTANEVNNWSLCGLGHDAINRSVCIGARCIREGFEEQCVTCKGEGVIWRPGEQALSEAWKETEPPAGPGYQLWETTSEGSPVSPVFPTLEQLCAWCAEYATTFGDAKASAEAWHKMLDDGFIHHTSGSFTFI
jgi:hypothetical protein